MKKTSLEDVMKHVESHGQFEAFAKTLSQWIVDNFEPKVSKEEQEEPKPRVGQICDFWDGPYKKLSRLSILCDDSDTKPKYMSQNGQWWHHAEVCRDPLTLGRTQAPEGAKWIAPWNYDMWGFSTEKPREELDGFFSSSSMCNLDGFSQTFPAPTKGHGPIKLWKDDNEGIRG